jgi:hypothetical protein
MPTEEIPKAPWSLPSLRVGTGVAANSAQFGTQGRDRTQVAPCSRRTPSPSRTGGKAEWINDHILATKHMVAAEQSIVRPSFPAEIR